METQEISIVYVLLPNEVGQANEMSLKRIESVCKILPIYQRYHCCAKKVRLDVFKNYELPEDDVKHMPLENVIISFNSDLNQLWRLTIDRNYACDSIYEWFMMWDNIRRSYVKYIKLCKDILSVRLNGKPIS